MHGLSTAGHQTYHGLSSAQRGLAEYSVDAKRRAREVADALRSPDWRQVPKKIWLVKSQGERKGGKVPKKWWYVVDLFSLFCWCAGVVI